MPKILVVDDDPCIRMLIQDVLAVEGYEVQAVPDGYAGLAAIDANKPDCVILDCMMPGIDGHEVLKRIRAAECGPELPVVMLTAAADDAQQWQAWTEGVDYFLAKPFDAEELIRYLAYLFEAAPV